MKAKTVLCVLALSVAVLSGCSKTEKEDKDKSGEAHTPGPLRENTVDATAAHATDTTIAWGGPADELQAGIVIGRRRAARDEPIPLVIHLRNLADRELEVCDAGHESSWCIVFTPSGGGTARRVGRFGVWTLEDRALQSMTLAGGETTVAVRCVIESSSGWSFTETLEAPAVSSYTRRRYIPPGNYNVTASYRHPDSRQKCECDRWHGELATGTVEIELGGERASPETGNGARSETDVACVPGTIVWGEPKGGVALGLSLSTHRLRYGEEMLITFHVKNVGNAPVTMIPPGGDLHQKLDHSQSYWFRFLSQDEDEWRYCHLHPDLEKRNKLATLEPGDVQRAGFSSERGQVPGPYNSDDASFTQSSTWPLLPGKYRVCARFDARRGTKAAGETRLWVNWIFSGELELTVAPYPFLAGIDDKPDITQEEIDRLYLQVRKSRGGDRKLMEIGDRKACLALIALLRSRYCGEHVARFLGERLGDSITYDLVRAYGGHYGSGSRFTGAAGETLGRLGTETTISAVEGFSRSRQWGVGDDFIRGLGQSQTRDSLELLGRLAREGSTAAVAALGKRQEQEARALLWVVVRAQSRASDHAARTLAATGDEEAVAWLASHWNWLNGLAFISAPIDWPVPGKGMLAKGEALAVALKALPALSERRAPVARCLAGKWYLVSASGHPARGGHFHYVILDAATGDVLKKREYRVLR